MAIHRPVHHPSPSISVVVPTVPEHTVDSLPGLESQRDVDYEVIIVKDSTLDICEARNEGIRRARSQLIAVTDDDTDPPEDWLSTAVEAFDRSDIALLEGPVRESDTYPRQYVGCNIAFSKDAWRRIGGFDPRYAGWGEDTVFGWDIEEAFGLDATRYSPAFEMSHPLPMRSELIDENERLMRREYQDRYFDILRQPDSLPGKLFVATAARTYRLAPSLWDRVL